MHDYHDALPGYDVRQILHDGCRECEARGANVHLALNHLDGDNFVRAWCRAADWNRGGAVIGLISGAESDLLRVLWAVQVHLERVGVPIGTVPAAGALAGGQS